MKIFKATMSLYLNQIFTIIISLFLVFPFYKVVRSKPMIFSAVTVLIYFMFMYSYSWNVGYRDGRKIPGYMPDKNVPVKLSVYTAILPVCLLLFRLIAPNALSSDILFLKGESDFFLLGCRTVGVPDFFYRLWFFPFAAFVPTGNILAYILELFILPVVIFAGYFVGLKRFSIMAFLKKKLIFAEDTKKKQR